MVSMQRTSPVTPDWAWAWALPAQAMKLDISTVTAMARNCGSYERSSAFDDLSARLAWLDYDLPAKNR
jgi:hypothetical protein